MRALLVVGLLLFCLLPTGGASVVEEPAPIGHFEFDQAAARPPAVLEGVLVLRSEEAMTVRGSIVLNDQSMQRLGGPGHGEEPSQEPQILAQVDEELEPFETVQVQFTVPVDAVGTSHVSFVPNETGGGWYDMWGSASVVGLAPVEVTVEGLTKRMVSVPGRPAQMNVTITALPGSDLTDLRLSAEPFLPDIEVGNLTAGQSRTVPIIVEADGEGGVHRLSGTSRAMIAPDLSGVVDGNVFRHPLYRSEGQGFSQVSTEVYIAASSTAFLLPPLDARLQDPTVIDVLILNAGSDPIRVQGRVRVDLPGLPHLRRDFDVDQRVAAGSVETVALDWTPSAAGFWHAELQHDLHRYGRDTNALPVAGPIAKVDLRLPDDLRRGEQRTVQVELTASEDIEVEGLTLTSSRAPQRGVISIDDLFGLQSVGATSLDADSPRVLDLVLTPKATGPYDLYIVVETPEGPSVHDAGSFRVAGSTGGWPLAWSPTFLLWVLVGVHLMWRGRWVR